MKNNENICYNIDLIDVINECEALIVTISCKLHQNQSKFNALSAIFDAILYTN